jgi:hypothetical protein
VGVGDSLSATYELRGALPAGTWALQILPVAPGATLHADVVLERRGLPEQVLFFAQSNVPTTTPEVMAGGIDVKLPTGAFAAACGDFLTVRVRLLGLNPPGSTHWYFRLTTP